MTKSGHVFVIRGLIGKFVSDAAIVSTDRAFNVEPGWHEVAGLSDAEVFRPDLHRPSNWAERGWGRSPANRRVWFLDVTEGGSPDEQFERLTANLEDIAASRLTTSVPNRPVPLVALPIIGTHGGGLGDVRGRIIERLLSVCADFTQSHAIDVAIVAANDAPYAALQHQRRKRAAKSFSG